MAKGGKHALPGGSKLKKSAKKSAGAHVISRKDTERASEGNTAKRKPKKHKLTFSVSNILRALLLLLICFVMISPMKGCLLTDSDYIGIAAAQRIAIDDSGIPADKAGDIKADIVKIDGDVFYKIQFTGTVTDYRYIIDADNGAVVARAFYHIDGEE
ncbi:MAG: PepSY domain-containing protein [Bacillota bacterium]|nr:PepSY domain-containing protein [Bacillota bacterium]